MTEPLLKARDVSALLGLEMGTVLDRFEAGDIPGFRLWGRKGGPVRFRRSDIEAQLAQWRVGPPCTVACDQEKDPAACESPRAQSTGGDSSHATPILRPVDE